MHIGFAHHLDSHIILVEERMFGRCERRDRNGQLFCWHSFLAPIHKDNIRWWLRQRQIVESFVESNMVAVLDSIRERVIPYDVLQSVGPAPEEDSLLGVLDVLRLILPSQDLDP